QATSDGVYVSHSHSPLQCAAVAAAVYEKLEQSPDIAQLKDVLIGVGTTSCQEDRWSQELLACFNSAAGDKEIEACAELVSPEQKENFGHRFRNAFSPAAAAP